MSQYREGQRISDLIKEKLAKDEVFYSFEYFPPRTDQGTPPHRSGPATAI